MFKAKCFCNNPRKDISNRAKFPSKIPYQQRQSVDKRYLQTEKGSNKIILICELRFSIVA